MAEKTKTSSGVIAAIAALVLCIVFPRSTWGYIVFIVGGYWANRSAVLHLVVAAVVNPALQFYPSYLQKYPKLAAYQYESTYTESNLAPRLVMLGTADEVLDYRVAEAAFPDSEVKIIEGGSHAGYDFLDEFLQAAWLTIQQADFCAA